MLNSISITSLCFLYFFSLIKADTTIHVVHVGADGTSFNPNIVYANAGDIVSFQFWPTNHSVNRGVYYASEECPNSECNPCIPWSLLHPNQPGMFFSKNFLTQEVPSPENMQLQSYNLTINDTLPYWYYCTALASCADNGMVGVINPSNGTSIIDQIAAAKNSTLQLSPGQSWPAESGPIGALLTSTSSSATASPTNSPSSTASPPSTSSSSSSHKLSTGAIAGIAIGAVALLALLAALFFFVGRSKAYRDVLTHGAPSSSRRTADTDTVKSMTTESRVGLTDNRRLDPHSNSHPHSHSHSSPHSSPHAASHLLPPHHVSGPWSPSTRAHGGASSPSLQSAPAMTGSARHASPPLGESGSGTFVGYNRWTGAPEFANEAGGETVYEVHDGQDRQDRQGGYSGLSDGGIAYNAQHGLEKPLLGMVSTVGSNRGGQQMRHPLFRETGLEEVMRNGGGRRSKATTIHELDAEKKRDMDGDGDESGTFVSQSSSRYHEADHGLPEKS